MLTRLVERLGGFALSAVAGFRARGGGARVFIFYVFDTRGAR